MKQRKKGTVIIERDDAILVTNLEHHRYLLPGGGVEGHESRLQAAIRELKEETGLDAESAVFLFTLRGRPHHRAGFQDRHKVYLVRAFGKPGHKTAWHHAGDNLPLASSTSAIIAHYRTWKTEHAELGQLFQTYVPKKTPLSADQYVPKKTSVSAHNADDTDDID